MDAGDPPGSGFPEQPPAHWPARLPPPPAEQPPPTRGGAAAILAAAVAFTLVVTYGLGQALVRADDPGDRVVPAPTTTTAPVAGEVPLALATPTLIEFVEDERDARFSPVPQVVGLAEADFEVAAATVADRDQALARHEITYRALGLTGPDDNLRLEMRTLVAKGSMAIYDASAGAVLVRGDTTTPYSRSEIVAALTHAIDSQLPSLPDPPPTKYDSTFAAEAVAAGSAAAVSAAYVATLSQVDQASYAQDRRQIEGRRGVSGASQLAQFIDTLPTLAGREIVFDLLGTSGGSGAVDQAFADPPETSEQAFDPEAFASAEAPLAVAALSTPPGQVLDSGRFGYVDVLVTLFPGVDVPNGQGSPEWGGGRFQTWRAEGGDLCVRASVVGDSDEQTTSLRSRFQSWADRTASGATVDLVEDASLGRPVVGLRRCS
jgi:hypothetical protein